MFSAYTSGESADIIEDMPPLIANYAEGHFELNDGNHRLEALKRLGKTEYVFFIWITENKFTENAMQEM